MRLETPRDPALPSTDWCYYKLYVGSKHDAIDYLITDALDDALDIVGDRPWFFLRYIDERGVHLRFRAKLGAAGRQDETALYAALHNAITQLAQAPQSTYAPLVSMAGNPPEPPRTPLPVICERAEYEPELDKYGGERGMPIAEALFHRSSELAREALQLEREGRVNRKDLALAVFVESMDVLLKDGEARPFLERYATFWLAGNPAIGAFKAAFAERAYEILDAGEPIVPARDTLDGNARAWIAAWRAALADAQQGYGRHCPAWSPTLAERLAFHFSHLMNNRLGFNAIDEAYLASLLAKAYEAGYRHAVA
ncbi:thiopeptide-type bacteriocin biosynthesis protein [Burkholderia sp. 22PA0106]|uniref:thiopeptide-type bacteriocin biosynthesis protein n=1 Tax=Burkholderia sp. 22PA0106 TaxID=3237371 RepID=UPI0039C34F00